MMEELNPSHSSFAPFNHVSPVCIGGSECVSKCLKETKLLTECSLSLNPFVSPYLIINPRPPFSLSPLFLLHWPVNNPAAKCFSINKNE